MSLAGADGYEGIEKRNQLMRTLALIKKAIESQKQIKEVKGIA